MSLSDKINLVLAVATVLMAGGTLYLAIVTRKLAEDTADGIKQADRHHREDLRPFCVIAFAKPSDLQPFGADFDPEDRRRAALMAGAEQVSQAASIYVRGDLQNKGKGPAKDVFLYFNTRLGEGEDGAFRLTRPVVVSGLVGAADTLTIDVAITERDIMHTWDGRGWRPTQIFSAIAGQAYEVVLEYKDVFGNTFRTVHPRGIWTPPVPDVGDPAKRSEMSIRPNGPTPAFLTGRQVVRTQADLPPQPYAIPPDGEMQF